jgi:hypothetical protein
MGTEPLTGTDGDRDRNEAGRAQNQRPRDRYGRPMPHGSAGEVERVPDDAEFTVTEGLEEAQRLLDAGYAFTAHEVLEAVWKSVPDPERELWRGLAQTAVGRGMQRGVAGHHGSGVQHVGGRGVDERCPPLEFGGHQLEGGVDLPRCGVGVRCGRLVRRNPDRVGHSHDRTDRGSRAHPDPPQLGCARFGHVASFLVRGPLRRPRSPTRAVPPAPGAGSSARSRRPR